MLFSKPEIQSAAQKMVERGKTSSDPNGMGQGLDRVLGGFDDDRFVTLKILAGVVAVTDGVHLQQEEDEENGSNRCPFIM